MQTWTFPEIHPTSDGPWRDEPDKAQWVDEATGLDCLIHRNPGGALCGYVGLPPGHPWYGKGPWDLNVRAHGGLNFASKCQEQEEGAPEGIGICHVPLPGRPADVWWLGFDCGHAFDLMPGMLELYEKIGFNPRFHGEYRTFGYVQAECASLAAQLATVD